MTRPILILISLLLLSVYNGILSQDDYFFQYNRNIAALGREKIYLHIDRNIYSGKEDIWFKIYLLDGKTNIPITGENTVYVDLAGPEGEISIHKPFYIQNGTCNGNFTVNDSLKTGVYTIYAYTNYMKNFGIESFFKKEITINQILVNKYKQVITGGSGLVSRKELPGLSVDLQFMPEGGYLSSNMGNTLAFKITAANNKGINLSGAIKDQNGNFIDSLYSTHLGMGKINFRAQQGMKYYAVLNKFPSDTFPLPLVQNKPRLHYEGIRKNLVRFMLFDTSGNVSDRLYYFAIKAKGTINFYLRKRHVSTVSDIDIPLDKFQPGLNQGILLDSTFKPLAERLFYIPGVPRVEMDIQLDKEIFNTRGKTQVSFKIVNKKDATVGGSFSLAVINLDQIGTDENSLDNIFSYLELSSEIRGDIENPGYYFSKPYNEVKEELDLLLLTQGWTKYAWDEGYLVSLPPFRFEKEEGLPVTGHAERFMFKKALEQGDVILLIPEKNLVYESTTDSTGRFRFNNLILFDSTIITVQTKSKSSWQSSRLIDVKYNITGPPIFPEHDTLILDDAYIEAYLKNAYPRYVSNSYFNFDKSSKLIPEVTIIEKRKPEDDGHFRRYGSSSNADNVIDMENYESMAFHDIFSILYLVPGLIIMGEEIYIRMSRGTPLLLLDDIEIDMERFKHIPPQEIDKIEILKNASNTAVFGVRGGNGVIAVYTKRGEIEYYEPPILYDIITKSIEGYAKSKEFYSPDYENPETKKDIIDHRATIFWMPNLVPDSTGTSTISFFNSDDEGRIAVISEGILNNGKPGVAKAFYKVKREGK